MDDVVRNRLCDLERHRLTFEMNFANLKNALLHWQTFEAEYECLKEIISSLPSDATEKGMIEIGSHFGGDLVNEKEIKELVGYDKSIRRSSEQVVGLLSRRIDYVRDNVSSVQKQLEDAKLNLHGISVLSSSNVRNDEALQATEIYEELDEEDNVTFSRTSHPGDEAQQLLEALKIAGVKDVNFCGAAPFQIPLTTAKGCSNSIWQPSLRENADSFRTLAHPETAISFAALAPSTRKKSVLFAEGTKSPPSATNKPANEFVAGHVSALVNDALAPGERLVELDDSDNIVTAKTGIMSIDDSPQDATMRKQMLQYSMSEVGSIVAQLDLEENGSDASESDDYSVKPGGSGSVSSADDEDDHGISGNRGLTDIYRKGMLELEAKLNARMVENLGQEANIELEGLAKHARRLLVQPDKDVKVNVNGAEEQPQAKGVRSTQQLGAIPASPRQSANISMCSSSQPEPATSATATIEAIVERYAPQKSAIPSQPRKTSRFESTRGEIPLTSPLRHAAINDGSRRSSLNSSESSSTLTSAFSYQQRPAQSVPSNIPLTPNIIERVPSQNPVTRTVPLISDEFEPSLLREQVKAEYCRQRERLLEGQGGFLVQRDQSEEEEGVSAGEQEKANDPRTRISLFKAARLKSSN